MKYPILLSLFLACQFAMAQTTKITTFDDLMASLNAGARVRVVIHYAKCTRPPEEAGEGAIPEATSGMNIGTYEHFAAGAVHNKLAFVVFANSELIQNPIGKGFVYNYGKVRVNADQTVKVTAKYLNPRNFKELMTETFNCKLNDGIGNEGVFLYK